MADGIRKRLLQYMVFEMVLKDWIEYFFILFIYFVFLGPHSWHMEIPRLGVKSELQLPAYTAATETWDPSRICNLHHSSWQTPDPQPTE